MIAVPKTTITKIMMENLEKTSFLTCAMQQNLEVYN